MPLTHLLYLHGFRSSPRSAKAQIVAKWLARHRPELQLWLPQLPPSPAEAMQMIHSGLAPWPSASMAVMGSSLGGFYATVLAEARGCRAVVLNPAIHPERDLARHIGHHSHWHDPASGFDFLPRHVEELTDMQISRLAEPQRYAAVIAKGDELLDWREMAARYQGAQMRLLEGSDHALSDFEDHLSFVMHFLELC
ncbi:MAG: esterase [Ideonella sp. MAG2]|nr:MAG: esterase [Ideonella sp. MAG2]